jgi:hypothetical protein
MSTLLPGFEKRPVHPIPDLPRPGIKYHVHDDDTWESVARTHGVTVQELIAYNCGTGVTPEEINWYLHVRVGCNLTTHDRKNWRFSRSAHPGYIYIPTPGMKTGLTPASQNPKINTLYGGPTDKGCGEMEWLVAFELPRPAGNDGWIIQQINRSYDIRESNGSVADAALNAPKPTYWEAWPVKRGATITANRYDPTSDPDGRTYDDSFDQPRRPFTKGEFRVVALAKFYEGPLPSTFIKNNPATKAEDLPSTTTRPSFWDGTGTVHNLTVVWDCTKSVSPSKISTRVVEQR